MVWISPHPLDGEPKRATTVVQPHVTASIPYVMPTPPVFTDNDVDRITDALVDKIIARLEARGFEIVPARRAEDV